MGFRTQDLPQMMNERLAVVHSTLPTAGPWQLTRNTQSLETLVGFKESTEELGQRDSRIGPVH